MNSDFFQNAELNIRESLGENILEHVDMPIVFVMLHKFVEEFLKRFSQEFLQKLPLEFLQQILKNYLAKFFMEPVHVFSKHLHSYNNLFRE